MSVHRVESASAIEPAPVGRPALGVAAVVLVVWAVFDATAARPPVPVPVGALATAVVAPLLPGVPVAVLARMRTWPSFWAVCLPTSFGTHAVVGLAQAQAEMWHPRLAALGVQILSAVLLALAARDSRRTSSGIVSGGFASVRSEDDARWSWRVATALGCAAALALHVWGCHLAASVELGVYGVLGAYQWPNVVAIVLAVTVLAGCLVRPGLDAKSTAVALATLVVVVSTFLPLTQGTPSFPTSWAHRSFIEIIGNHGALPGGLDARFSWAGFFSAVTYLVASIRPGSVDPMLTWAPLWVDLLLYPLLYLVAFRVTGSRRVTWIALALYALTNWFQQDYFAPQSIALILYLSILGLVLSRVEAEQLRGLLRWVVDRAPRLKAAVAPRADVDRYSPGLDEGERPLVVDGVICLAIVGMVVSHQITPMILVVSLTALAVFGWLRQTLLPVFAVVVFVAWFSYGAHDYWQGHFQELVGGVGQVSGAVSAGVTDRLGADPVYSEAQRVRMMLSGGLYLLALAGMVLSWRAPRRWPFAGLAFTSFSLVAMQSYGGEGIIRCFLLGTPFAVPFAALAVWAVLRRIRARSVVAATALSATVLAVTTFAFVLSRGLNASFEQTPRSQLAVTDLFVEQKRPGLTVGAFGPAPLLYRDSLVYTHEVLDLQGEETLLDPVAEFEKADTDYYYIQLQYLTEAHWTLGIDVRAFEDAVREFAVKNGYGLAYETPDLVILYRHGVPPIPYAPGGLR